MCFKMSQVDWIRKWFVRVKPPVQKDERAWFHIDEV
jgi:hypothetical protein